MSPQRGNGEPEDPEVDKALRTVEAELAGRWGETKLEPSVSRIAALITGVLLAGLVVFLNGKPVEAQEKKKFGTQELRKRQGEEVH